MKHYISEWTTSVRKQTIKKTVFSLFTVVALQYSLQAQTTPKLQDPSNTFIVNKALDIDAGGGVIYFKDHELLQGQLFSQYFSITGLGAYDSMHLVETTHDSILADENSPTPNLTHNLYQQYYKGVPVEGALYTEHYEAIDGNVLSTSGFVVENLNLSVTPQVSESAALAIAKSYKEIEHLFQETAVGKLIIIPKTGVSEITAEDYVLAWQFTLIADTPHCNTNVYIDATTGSFIKEINNMHADNFNHLYYGRYWDLDTYEIASWLFASNYYLFANDNGRNIYTNKDYGLNYKTGAWDIKGMPMNSGSTSWHSNEQEATSSHYSATKAWDFFKNNPFNRNGISGWGNHIRVLSSYGFTDNLYESVGNEDYILVGTTGGSRLATHDLIGHEFTHGIINRTRPLPTERTSGAINESFADIFGFMVERYVFGSVQNWTIGEAVSTYRNMQFPTTTAIPSASYYLDNYWVTQNMTTVPTPSNDYVGIHKNSGVQNKWFYLLSMGGSQPIYINNVLQPTRTVSGIGIDKAARIAYYAMTNLTNYNAAKNTTFDAVRANTITAAKILYGYCSNEYIQTCRAWYAVNVGTSCDPCLIVPNWYSRNFPYQQVGDLMGTGLKERENQISNLRVFPNPASNKVKIVVEETNADLGNNQYDINIVTVDGKLVYSQTYNSLNNVELDIANLQAGVYFVQVKTATWTKNSKFVKQ
ncbi:MAG: M4 family metallopeptidase [Bacteroidota bacterium]